MEDIAPKLFETVQEEFKRKFENDSTIKKLYDKISKGSATYKEAHEFAIKTGEILSGVFNQTLSSAVLPDGRMYYNIAERVIGPMLQGNYDIVSEVSSEIQKQLNEKAGIGIKAIRPEFNQNKAQGIIDIVSEREKYDEIAYMLREPIINFTQAIVDDAVRANADFQSKAGLSPKIVRTSTRKCCAWCDSLAGVYDYDKVSDTGNDVFRRHQHCKCLVEYEPGDGTRQNVHTKKWSEEEDSGKIEETPRQREARIKRENNLELIERIASHPRMLQAYTPRGLKEVLEREGYDVKPLNRGSLKGKLFEEGGGYKVNFGGDGILQYHPEEQSHHGGEYYKINRGNIGKKWYNMEGDEIDVEETRRLGKQVKKKVQNTDDK